MKLTIDTKEESKEEIKKIIVFLQKLVEEGYSSYNTEPPTSTQGAFNMFGSDSSSESNESFNTPSSSMDMFSSDTPTNSNIFAENSSSDIYAEKKEETFNIHDMLEEY